MQKNAILFVCYRFSSLNLPAKDFAPDPNTTQITSKKRTKIASSIDWPACINPFSCTTNTAPNKIGICNKAANREKIPIAKKKPPIKCPIVTYEYHI